MNQLPVLDDNTRDAIVIGYAADADEAARVYAGYMAEREITGDDEQPARPAFARRSADGSDFREIDASEIANGFFEPIF